MKKILPILILLVISASCANDSTDDLTIPPPEVISYVVNVKPIIDQSCATAGCHNAASSSAGLVLETYAQVRNAFETRGALGRMQSSSNLMPPTGNLPGTTIAIITAWINHGYLER